MADHILAARLVQYGRTGSVRIRMRNRIRFAIYKIGRCYSPLSCWCALTDIRLPLGIEGDLKEVINSSPWPFHKWPYPGLSTIRNVCQKSFLGVFEDVRVSLWLEIKISGLGVEWKKKTTTPPLLGR